MADSASRPAPLRRYALVFVGVLLGLFTLELLHPVQQHVVLPWSALLASACVGLVSAFDATVVAQGKVIWNPETGFGVSIESGCNGLKAFMVLCASVLAFPASWRERVWGLVLGFAAIQGLNVVRVISLYYLGQWNMAVFHFAHAYLWQAFIMLDVLVFWLLWARGVQRRQA